MVLINVRYRKDLITIDLSTRQIRYLHNVEQHGLINFIPLSRDDVDGYEYLYKHDKKLFLKSLIEDVYNNLGIKLQKKDLKIVKR